MTYRLRISFFILIFSILSAAVLFAQQPQLGMFQSRSSDNPIIAGEGITRYLIDGDNLMTRGEYENAILAYDNAIAQNPYFPEAYIKRALAKYRLGRITEAQQDYQYATRLNPYIADMYGYGNNLSRLKVLAFEPYQLSEQLQLERQLAYYESLLPGAIEEMREAGSLSGQLAWVSELIRQFPDSASYILQRAVLHIYLGDKRKAKYDIESALQLENRQALAHSLYGLVLEDEGEADNAEQAFEEALALDPELAIANYQLGRMRLRQLEHSEAMVLLNRALAIDPALHPAYFSRAQLHKAMGNLEMAMADYNHLLQKDTDYTAKVWLNRGITRKMSGDLMGALSDIERALSLGQEDNAVLYKMRGNIYLMLGKYFMAEEDYSRSIELNPAYAEAYYNRGIARILAYNRPDACVDFQESADLGYSRGEEQLRYLCSY